MRNTAFFSVGPRSPGATLPGVDNRYRTDMHGIETVIQTGRAFEGRCVVVAKYDSFWASGGKDYVGPVLENPTWKALLGQATKVMKSTRDFHHCFFEGYTVRRMRDDGVFEIELFMGS